MRVEQSCFVACAGSPTWFVAASLSLHFARRQSRPGCQFDCMLTSPRHWLCPLFSPYEVRERYKKAEVPIAILIGGNFLANIVEAARAPYRSRGNGSAEGCGPNRRASCLLGCVGIVARPRARSHGMPLGSSAVSAQGPRRRSALQRAIAGGGGEGSAYCQVGCGKPSTERLWARLILPRRRCWMTYFAAVAPSPFLRQSPPHLRPSACPTSPPPLYSCDTPLSTEAVVAHYCIRVGYVLCQPFRFVSPSVHATAARHRELAAVSSNACVMFSSSLGS